ncbi:hypothetical protein DRQ33_05845 [bacterium]|nr:MAG: hypothetical protein DRQ33_05845 [bacterium]
MKIFEEFYKKFWRIYNPYDESGHKRMETLSALIEEYIQLPPGSLILDVGCGGAISTIALIKNQYNTVGIDIRLDAVKLGWKYIREKYLPASIICADSREIPIKNEIFDGATLLFNPFPHWSLEDFWNISSEILRTLKSGGICVMEFADFIQLKYQNQWKDILLDHTGDRTLFSISGMYNSAEGTIPRTFIDPESGENWTVDFHLWSQWLIDFVLNKVGFEEIEFIRQSTDFPRKICIARKK